MTMIRRMALVAALLSVGGQTPAQTTDRPPTQPAGLSAAAYGTTSGGISWRRSTDDRGAVRGYEVTRDGVVVVPVRDALSHIEQALEPGTAYRFGVTAIDSAGQRSASSFTTLTTKGAATPSATLAAPTGLRVRVYSATNGEIFWTRPTTFGLRYEVFRNDRKVATTDGISYYDDTLSGGRTYDYAVVAINRQGRRSAAAKLTLSTGGSVAAGGDPAPPASGAPAVPSGLRASVYSSTAAGIAWTRPSTPGLRYDVSRDGTKLVTIAGVSHVDNALPGGRSHVYEVVAIDRQGRRSGPATIRLATPANGTSPTAPIPPTTPTTPAEPTTPTTPTRPGSPMAEPSDYYERDGYGTVDIVRMDVRTATTKGTCNVNDQSGCTLDDVNGDTDASDELTVEIPVHFQAEDFADDGSGANAELRQRGSTSRLDVQKSYRIKLDSKKNLWRGERRIQLNKNALDSSKIRNKLAFDLMSMTPSLPSMRTQFVDLWIDDGQGAVPYGLFTHAESAVEEYLVNRGWDKRDHLYKAEKFLFSGEDLSSMELDAEGNPVDEEAFETRIEIKGGDDHRKLVEMIRAVNDKSVPFERTFARYFDEDNVVTWIAVNFLIRQMDAVTHNFYLYNPVGSDKFFIIPWDYDQTFAFEAFPTGGFSERDLLRRLAYGYARGTASNFLKAVYKTPGLHRKVLAKADELRNGPFSDSSITERASRYTEVVAPIAGRQPDRYRFKRDIHTRFAEFVSRSHDALRSTYSIPLPPSLSTPVIKGDQVEFHWSPAHDVTGDSLTYDLEVSRSAGFGSGERVLLETRIPDSQGVVLHDVPLDRFPSGTLYARLVARVDRDPSRFWQISSNRAQVNGETRVGIREFRIP